MFNNFKYMGVKYTGKNITNHFDRPHLLNNSDELNILADATEKRLGLRYKTHLINCNFHHRGFNAVCKSTVNLDFLILQHRRTKMQNIQQGTNNEGKWKEARRRQTKQWLIMLNRLPEGKE